MRTMRWVVAVAMLCTLGSALQAAEMPTQEELLAAAGDQSGGARPLQVGEEVSRDVASPAVSRGDGGKPVWTYELTDVAGSYIAPHFSYFNLPQGAKLVIASPDGSRKWEYTGTGKGELGLKDGFWGIHIAGDTAVLRLFSAVDLPAGVIRIDKYARGYHIPGGFESLCGTDDSGWAPCYQTSHPGVYNKSRAVARLLINGLSLCTGWLVGSDGHLMTNEHCINTNVEAANTDFEFMAEGATCATNCASQLGCPGTIVATSSTLVQFDAFLDYALVKLPVNPTTTYGFLQMRNNGTNAGEKIYIPQHPAGWGKKIALFSTHPNDTTGYAEVQSTNRTACHPLANHMEVGYYADTQGGSSGSPVIGLCDHTVLALHHCGNCPNLGVPMELIIQDLENSNNVPPNGTARNSWSCGECGPGYCKQGEYCDGLGCYPASSTISRAICQCGLTAPQCGFGACYGDNYCEGPNCQWPVCYINTAPASQIFCGGMHLDPFCNVVP